MTHLPSFALVLGLCVVSVVDASRSITLRTATKELQKGPRDELFCALDEPELKCSEGEGVLRIHSAVYGRAHSTGCDELIPKIAGYECDDDGLELVQGECEGKTSCIIDVSDSYYMCDLNPFSTLKVVYDCGPENSSDGLTPELEYEDDSPEGQEEDLEGDAEDVANAPPTVTATTSEWWDYNNADGIPWWHTTTTLTTTSGRGGRRGGRRGHGRGGRGGGRRGHHHGGSGGLVPCYRGGGFHYCLVDDGSSCKGQETEEKACNVRIPDSRGRRGHRVRKDWVSVCDCTEVEHY